MFRLGPINRDKLIRSIDVLHSTWKFFSRFKNRIFIISGYSFGLDPHWPAEWLGLLTLGYVHAGEHLEHSCYHNYRGIWIGRTWQLDKVCIKYTPTDEFESHDLISSLAILSGSPLKIYSAPYVANPLCSHVLAKFWNITGILAFRRPFLLPEWPETI